MYVFSIYTIFQQKTTAHIYQSIAYRHSPHNLDQQELAYFSFFQKALPLKGATLTLSTLILSLARLPQLNTISSRSADETAWKVAPAERKQSAKTQQLYIIHPPPPPRVRLGNEEGKKKNIPVVYHTPAGEMALPVVTLPRVVLYG